jgi:hypothetical protein
MSEKESNLNGIGRENPIARTLIAENRRRKIEESSGGQEKVAR